MVLSEIDTVAEFWTWCIAGPLLGFALGFLSGKLFDAMLTRWETAGKTSAAITGVIAFLLGGSTLKLFANGESAALYVIGISVGLLFYWKFGSASIPRCTLDVVRLIVDMNDSLHEKVKDRNARAILIASSLSPRIVQLANNDDPRKTNEVIDRAADEIIEPPEGD